MFNLNQTVANLLELYLFPFFTVAVGLDAKNSSTHVITVSEIIFNNLIVKIVIKECDFISCRNATVQSFLCVSSAISRNQERLET